MKIIIKHNILGICCMLFLGGCFDLSETAYTTIASDQFKASESDLVAMVGAAYTPLRNIMGWYGYFDPQEECTDEIVTPSRPNGWYDGGTYVRMHEHKWTTQQGQSGAIWGNYYDGINKVNLALAQFESGTLPVDEATLAPYIAELRALRALYYSVLLDNFGNVPIVTTFSDEIPDQKTRQQVYDFVISEILAVIDLLSEDASTTYGRMNKWAAYCILARTYLNAEVYTGAPQWQKCINACEQIISSTKYNLEGNYKDIFKTDNQSSKEIIFAVPYDEVYAKEWCMHQKTLAVTHAAAWNLKVSCWGGGATAIPQFIDTYDTDDQRLYDTWLQGNIINVNTNAVAFTYVKALPAIQADENGGVAGAYDGYRVGKYEIKEGARALSNDFPYFRYADVLMMKAECLMRQGDANSAATIVTQIRQRAFKDTPAKATVTGTQLLANSKYQYGTVNRDGSIKEAGDQTSVQYGGFYDELGWEFACEARRRTDMIRFGTFWTKSWFYHKPNTSLKDRGAIEACLFPIPYDEIAANSKLEQNPGY